MADTSLRRLACVWRVTLKTCPVALCAWRRPERSSGPQPDPGGALGSWIDAQFISTLRIGTMPNGKQLDSEFIPWTTFKNMTDDELGAIRLYLESQPARELEG